MKTLTAKYIKGLESLPETELTEVFASIEESHGIDCVNWKEFPYSPEVSFKAAFSEKAIAIRFEVTEDHVKAVSLEDNGPVWEDSCVEFFIGNPVGEGYFNFELNCIGTLLAAKRRSKTDADMFTAEQLAQVRRVCSLQHELTDRKEAGQRWWAVEVIPFNLLGLENAPAELNVNFYKCGDNCEKPHFLSWSPIGLPEPNFHCPEFFGKFNLG